MDAELRSAIEKLNSNIEKLPQNKKSDGIWGVFYKILGVAGVAGILGLFAMNDQLNELSWEVRSLNETVDKLESFTQKPRFTKDDFHSEMRLYDNRLLLSEKELIKRATLFDQIDERLRDLETRVTR